MKGKAEGCGKFDTQFQIILSQSRRQLQQGIVTSASLQFEKLFLSSIRKKCLSLCVEVIDSSLDYITLRYRKTEIMFGKYVQQDLYLSAFPPRLLLVITMKDKCLILWVRTCLMSRKDDAKQWDINTLLKLVLCFYHIHILMVIYLFQY